MKDIQKHWEEKQEREIFNPSNLEEVFEWMDNNMPGFLDNVKEASEEKIVSYHHGIGTWLRNNLHLWEDCGKPYEQKRPLMRWFNDNGIYHPDDVSAIIFTSLSRHLKGEDLRLNEQFKYYQDYWEKTDPNVNRGEM